MTDDSNRLPERDAAPPPPEDGDIRRTVSALKPGHPFAVLTSRRAGLDATGNAAPEGELKRALRRLDFGYQLVKGARIADGDKAIEDGVLVFGDDYLDHATFRKIMENLGERFHQDMILLGSGGDEVVRVATRDTARVDPYGARRRLWRFSPIRIDDYLKEGKGGPFTLLASKEGHVARTRRAMGWAGGLWVQVTRAEAAPRHAPSREAEREARRTATPVPRRVSGTGFRSKFIPHNR